MEVLELTQEQESEEGIGAGQEVVELREEFTEGQLVEVRTSDDLELGDSWFTARIIKLPDNKADSIFVEYENVPSHLPKSIFVNVSLIRPVQLQDPPIQFLLNQIVDAFHGNGWWQGKFIEVHDDSRYTVCFPNSKRQNMEFGKEDLRAHQDWIGGKWVQPQDECWVWVCYCRRTRISREDLDDECEVENLTWVEAVYAHMELHSKTRICKIGPSVVQLAVNLCGRFVLTCM